MPNWCFSDIEIKSTNTDKLKRIYDKINIALTEPPIDPSDFGSAWLGNILTHFNINNGNISCRGTLESINYIEELNILNILTETAWDIAPALETIEAILKHENLNAELTWRADEYGNEYHVTNDPTFKICDGKYHLIFMFDGTHFNNSYDTLEDALRKASELTHQNICSIEDFEKFANSIHNSKKKAHIELIEYKLVTEH